MKQPEFPMEVRDGSQTVTIYEREFTKGTDSDGKPRRYVEYRLAYYQNGKRKVETSSDFLALRTRADEVLEDLEQGRTESHPIKAADRIELAQAKDVVRPTGKSLLVAAKHFSKAFEILGEDLVIEAASEYKRRRMDLVATKSANEAVEDFILSQERKLHEGTLREVYVTRQASRLRRFADSVSNLDLSSVTVEDMDRFLDSLKKPDGAAIGSRTRDNWADEMVQFFEWAKLKRLVPADYDETQRITRLSAKRGGGEIVIYTPAEMEKLLSRAGKSVTPALAIGAFAGVRTAEIRRLDWSDVKMDNGEPRIEIGRDKAKTRARRSVPMSANLKAWLKPYAKAAGEVWPWSEPQLHAVVRELCDLAKVERKHNGGRHSFISYRLAVTRNDAQVALEAGNSPTMIHGNYNELVTREDAEKWFAIFPSRPKQSKRKKAK
jgi:integrase